MPSSPWKALVAIPRRSAWFLWRYLPHLIVLVSLAIAARSVLTTWLAVTLSNLSPWFGVFIKPLAPFGFMGFIVVALWIVGSGSPLLRRELSQRSRFNLVQVIALPALTCYLMLGLFRADTQSFAATAINEEAVNSTFVEGYGNRTSIGITVFSVALIAACLLLRKMFRYFEFDQRGIRWLVPVAYIEALWMATVGLWLVELYSDVDTWLQKRSFMVEFSRLLEGSAVDRMWSIIAGVLDFLANLGGEVIVPFAWLTLGFVLFRIDSLVLAEASTPQTVERVALWTQKDSYDSPASVGSLHAMWSEMKNLARIGLLPFMSFILLVMAMKVLDLGIFTIYREVFVPGDIWEDSLGEGILSFVTNLTHYVLIIPLVVAAVEYAARYHVGELVGSDR